MKWTKKSINLSDINSIKEQGKILAKDGNPLAEQLRCVFEIQNDDTIYVYPLLDFIDIEINKNFIKFYLYQMVS